MGKQPQLREKKRIIFLFIILLLIFLALIGRLVWIQVVNSSSYRNKALDQRLRKLMVEPKRGVIYDRKGKELAVSASSETIVGIPYEIEDPDRIARVLSKILDNDYQTIHDRITRQAAAVYIERKVTEEQARQVRQQELPGITSTEESKRYYPNDSLAAHILGFAGIDSQGLEGIELSYDKYLRGVSGKIAMERDAAGRAIPDGVHRYMAPENGHNLYLTIDEVIQYIVERELDKAMSDFDISGATALVMNPKTGALLALANRPTYDPNNFSDYPQKYWRNRAISDSFEPGSTFKIITTSSALEAGVVHENDIFVDPGYITVSKERISCWKHGGHGRQSFAEVVENSCNPGFVQVGMRLGEEEFLKYIEGFGFGQETGVKLPGEADGLVYNAREMGPVELATMSFGHGITVTPIQLITAVSAVANDGMLLKPRLVDKVIDDQGQLIEEIEPKPVRRVISRETSRRTLNLLERVVEQGTGSAARLEGYKIGGKTGTAKHYGQQIYDSSFIGVLPVDDPRLAILVVLYDLKGETYYASQTVAPIFRSIARDTLRYLEIPPRQGQETDDSQTADKVEVPGLVGQNIREAEKLLRKNGLHVKVVGDGEEVEKQIPLSGARVQSKSTVLLYTAGSAAEENYYVAVPDLKGLSREEASNLLAALGLKLKARGSGEVIQQEIQPGKRVMSGTEIEVHFAAD